MPISHKALEIAARGASYNAGDVPSYFLDDHGLVLLNEGPSARHFVAYWKMVCEGKPSYNE